MFQVLESSRETIRDNWDPSLFVSRLKAVPSSPSWVGPGGLRWYRPSEHTEWTQGPVSHVVLEGRVGVVSPGGGRDTISPVHLLVVDGPVAVSILTKQKKRTINWPHPHRNGFPKDRNRVERTGLRIVRSDGPRKTQTRTPPDRPPRHRRGPYDPPLWCTPKGPRIRRRGTVRGVHVNNTTQSRKKQNSPPGPPHPDEVEPPRCSLVRNY